MEVWQGLISFTKTSQYLVETFGSFDLKVVKVEKTKCEDIFSNAEA